MKSAVIAGFISLLALIGAGVVDLLVANPLYKSGGKALDEVYGGMSELDRSYGTTFVVGWAAAAGIAAVAYLIVGLTRKAPLRTAVTAAAAAAAVIVFAWWWAGFPFGMTLADQYAVSGGPSPFGVAYLCAGAAALVIAVVGARSTNAP